MQSSQIIGNNSSSYFPLLRRNSHIYTQPFPSSNFSSPKPQRSRSPLPAQRSNLSNTIPNLSPNNNNNTNAVINEGMKKMIEDINMYPSGFGDILKNQERYVKSFKLHINREKERVDEDLSSFKVELNHTLEDLRLSLHAQLDRVYQAYLAKIAKFKTELFDINRIKEQLEIELGAATLTQLQAKTKLDKQNMSKFKQGAQKDTEAFPFQSQRLNSYPGHQQAGNTSLQMQTLQTISNMEVGNQQLKKYYILNYISQVQKERVGPLSNLQREIVVLNQGDTGFYQSKEFLRILGHLRDVLSRETRTIYDNNFMYIRSIDDTSFKQKDRNVKILDGFQLSQPQNVSVLPQGTGYFVPTPMPMPIKLMHRMTGVPLNGTISPSEQSLRVNKVQNINLVQEPVNIQIPSNGETKTALCGIYINNQIAIGLKDGQIQVVSCDGHNITTLKQHKAGICTLAVLRTKNQNYLASGSDVGCSRTVVWDPVTWQPKHVMLAHQAAVTGIVDLQDDVHFVSTGYDRKLNIYSLEQGRVVYTAPPTDCPMTAILVNKTASKLVGCGLDKAIYVWQINRDYRLRAESVVLERKIQNNTTISSIVASQLLPELVVIVTKDCKVKLVNIDKGESYKTVPLGDDSDSSAYPLEICLIQRENKGYYPFVLVWPNKQQKLYQVNTENNLIGVKNFSPNCGTLQFGYGVSPKCFYVPDSGKGTLVYCINQRPHTGRQNIMSVHRVEQVR